MTGATSTGAPLIVAIDGPSGVGKSTVARRVAERLDVPYLSTGAMYRALAVEIVEIGIDPGARSEVEAVAEKVDLDLLVVDGCLEVLLRGVEPGARAYSLEVSTITSRISTYPGVRRRMVALQRAGALRQGAVLEGRDIGTRVFPETPHKFFLEASPEVRAERRWRQLRDSGCSKLTRSEVLREVLDRDERDTSREESPLTRDESYVLVETGDRSVNEVVDFIVGRVSAALDGRIPSLEECGPAGGEY